MKKEDYLESLYEGIDKDPGQTASAKLFTIIELKQHDEALVECNRSIYVDIKHFLTVFLSRDYQIDYGYDQIDERKIISVIEGSSLPEEKQYSLFEYAISLSSSVFVSIDKLSERKDYHYSMVMKKKSILYYLLALSSRSIKNILLTLLVVFLVEVLVLSPAPLPCLAIFDFSSSEICENEILNHIANVIALHLNSSEISSVTPTNLLATVLLFIWEIVITVFAINVLFSKLLIKIHINNESH